MKLKAKYLIIFFLILNFIFLFGCSLFDFLFGDSSSGGSGTTAIMLTTNTWTTGNLAAGEIKWYYFNATAGTKYYIQWDDSYQGSSSYTCDIKVSAYRENKTTSYFTGVDNGYNTPQELTAAATEKVYIKVEGYSSSSSGSFAIKYYTGSGSTSQDIVLSTNNTWTTGTLAVGEVKWYCFYALSADKVYEIEWDDGSGDKSGNYTCDIKVTVYDSNKQTILLPARDNSYQDPTIFIAPSDGLIYLKVEAYNPSIYATGTFAIRVNYTEYMAWNISSSWSQYSISADAKHYYYIDVQPGNYQKIEILVADITSNAGPTNTADVITFGYKNGFVNDPDHILTNSSFGEDNAYYYPVTYYLSNGACRIVVIVVAKSNGAGDYSIKYQYSN